MNKPLADIEEFGTIDAESDDLLALCFQSHPAFQKALEEQDRHFLILGRKGSGKTAIYKEIVSLGDVSPSQRQREHNIFSVGYTSADYPWHYHSKQVVSSAAEQERYLHSWRYYILLSLAKILLNHDQSQPWSDQAREAYGKLESFVKDTYGSISPQITEIFTPGRRLRNLNKLGIELGAKMEVDLSTQDLPAVFQEVNRSLEHLVLESLNPDHSYYICFDDLDLEFKAEAEHQQRLIGLILAARKFAVAAKEYRRRLKILVFLRSDIYRNSLSFNDKNKITDTYALEIEWDRTDQDTSLKSLMERRFAELLEIEPGGAWEKVFDETGNLGRFPSKYHFIRAHTFCRPRDMIKFCNCILNVYKQRRRSAKPESLPERFTSDIIYAARDEYSQYFSDEITNEIQNHYLDHRIYFEILQQIGYQVFSREQFLEAYGKWKDRLKENWRPEEILECLYEFSIIGFARPPLVSDPNSAEYNYKYMSPGAIFNRSSEWFCVHWGLVESLRLRRSALGPAINGKPDRQSGGQFESPSRDIVGSVNVVPIVDPSEPVPANIIPVNTAWIARVEWEVHGPLVDIITGNWNVSVFMESLGPGFEGQVGYAVVPLESGLLFSGPPKQRTYQVDITVPAGTPPPGAYKLSIIIVHEVRGGVTSPIMAFHEGPIMQFYSL